MQSTEVPCPKSIMVLFSVQSEDVLQAERGKQRIPKSAFECLSQRNKILTNLLFKVAHYTKDSPFYELTSQYCHFVKLVLSIEMIDINIAQWSQTLGWWPTLHEFESAGVFCCKILQWFFESHIFTKKI